MQAGESRFRRLTCGPRARFHAFAIQEKTMKLMLKAICQPNGDLVLCGDAKALLFRALEDARSHLAQASAGDAAQLQRTLAALQDVLGRFDGALPSAVELLGDPAAEQVRRNLLKG
jgi:hypothetical protein